MPIVEGKLAEIHDYIADGKEQYGMQTFDQHLAELVKNGEVAYEVAHAAASRPSDFDLQMRMLGGGDSNGGYTPRPTAAAAAVAAPASGGTREGDAVPMGMGFDFLSQG